MIESLLAQNTGYVSGSRKESALNGIVPTGDGASLDEFAEFIRIFEEQTKKPLGSIDTLEDNSGNSDPFDEMSVGERQKNRLSFEPQLERVALTAIDRPLTDDNSLSKPKSDIVIVPENKALDQEPQIDPSVWFAPPAAERDSLQVTETVLSPKSDPAPKVQPLISELKTALSSVARDDVTRIEKDAKTSANLALVSRPPQPVAEYQQSRPARVAPWGKAVVADTLVQTNFGKLSRQKPPLVSGASISQNTLPENSAKALNSTPVRSLAELSGTSPQSNVVEGDIALSQRFLTGGSKFKSPEPDESVGDKTGVSVSSQSSPGRDLTKSGPQTYPIAAGIRKENRQPWAASIPSVPAQQSRDSLVSNVTTVQIEPLRKSNAVSIAVPSEKAVKPPRLVDQIDVRRTDSLREHLYLRAYDVEALPKSLELRVDNSLSKTDARATPSVMIIGEQRFESPLLVASTLLTESSEAPIRTVLQSPDPSSSRQNFARTVLPQVSEAIRATSSGSVEIKLNPEELGRVKLVMTLQDAGMLVAFSTERSETMELIRRHVDLLAQELRQSGHQSVDFQFEGDGRRQEGRKNPPIVDDGTPATVRVVELSRSQSASKAELDGHLDIRI